MSEKDEKYAPMLEHLDELRTRLIRCVLALLLGMVICLALFQQQLADIIMGPFMALDQSLVYTGPAEGFLFNLKIALLGGCVLASPVIIWQIMRFILPALYSNEKKDIFHHDVFWDCVVRRWDLFWLFSGAAAGYGNLNPPGWYGTDPNDYGWFLYVFCVGVPNSLWAGV